MNCNNSLTDQSNFFYNIVITSRGREKGGVGGGGWQIETETHRQRQSERGIDKQRKGQKYEKNELETHTQTERWRRQTNRQTDKETDRQGDRQTEGE